MKPKFRCREIVLMTLPVLVVGGVAWWRMQGGSLAQLKGVPLGMERGQPRLEIESSEPLDLSPLDVSEGFVWGRKVILWEGGETPFEIKPGDTVVANSDIKPTSSSSRKEDGKKRNHRMVGH